MEEITKPNVVRRCAWFYFTFIVLMLATVNVGYLLLASFAPYLIQDTVALYVLQYVGMYAIALPLAALVLRKTPTVKEEKRSLTFSAFGIYFLLSVGCMLIGSIIGRIVTFLPSLIFQTENPISSLLNGNAFWFSCVLTVVVAPIGEEFLFRKLLIDRLKRHGTVVAVGLSALFFALFHQNFYQFFYAFLIGLLLGYLYATHGRLWYNILLHAAVNFVCGMLPTCFEVLAEKPSPTLELLDKQIPIYPFLSQFGVTILALFEYACAFFVFVFLVFYFAKSVHLQKGEEPMTTSNWDRIFLCDGLVVAVLFSAVLLLLSLLPI